jgi:hypothetical protein
MTVSLNLGCLEKQCVCALPVYLSYPQFILG